MSERTMSERTKEELEILRLAQIAYEAYGEATGWKSAITGAKLPPFNDTPDAVQVGWMAAAKAISKGEQMTADISLGQWLEQSALSRIHIRELAKSILELQEKVRRIERKLPRDFYGTPVQKEYDHVRA